MSKEERSYILPQETWEHVPAILSFSGSNISRFFIFLNIMSFAFVEAILASVDPGARMLQQGRFFQPTFTTIYKYIAIYIRIQGMYNVPVQCWQHCRPLRTAFNEARKYFLSISL